jgi:methionyl-tRNA synthetase
MESTEPKLDPILDTTAPAVTSAQPASNPVNPELAPSGTAPEEEIDIDLFSRIKLRTATIEAVELVPKSKKLYRIQLDVGELGKRQIVSGIAQHYTPEELVGQQIVIIANLKPAKLMGVESRGMLLAASTEGDGTLALLTPSRAIPAGSRVR